MKKKKGYPILLAVTVIFTIAGVVSVIIQTRKPSSPTGLVAAITPFILAGMTCAVRKRFFTVQQ